MNFKKLPVKKNVSLKDYTTFKVGGSAKFFFQAKTKQDIIKAVSLARELNLPFFILGSGSNLLIDDKGYNGLVINIKSSGFEINDLTIKADCGIMLGHLVNISAGAGLSGLEWATGIPGTIGAALRGNTGAFDHSISELVKSADVLTETGTVKQFENKDCGFSYRDSAFKRKNLIILCVELFFKKGNKDLIRKIIKKNLDQRIKNQPLGIPSAGSIFKNCESKITNLNLLRLFPELDEFNKKGVIPAAFLIEKCGLKGKKIGGAQVSEKHANFIVNFDGAKSKDILILIKLIKKEVKNKFGINLKEEIQFLKFSTLTRCLEK